ncbi:3'(2'),5'-bisphosphate nucleotidase [Podospora pseudopauciseta]|uniref:3'(2'),5'-bisphosphate nucleotidase n=1 Tax=Podospora pseudopauciseta TaxID=2093780 RepID=A0ABR0HDY0_9PEZI|nr:3'(2'),5'-bisphosphate nucleotidase [Podospora pseudopauciseta]
MPRDPSHKFRLPPLLLTSLLILILAAFIPSITPRLTLILSHLRSQSTTPNLAKMTSLYSRELEIAQLAVQRASILTKRVFHETSKGTVSKDDASPVTIGDFGAQALIISALKHNFPHDEIVAEEEATELRANPPLRDQIWELVRTTSLDDVAAEGLLGGGIKDADAMLDIIDQGNSKGGKVGRVWTIDPIDGTKGFLRGGQYAVCLALLEDGDVKVGAIGCPNLPVDDAAPLTADIGANATDDEGRGVLFSAVIGQGATSRPLKAGALAEGRSISMKPLTDMSNASFCESVEAGHSNQSESAQIAQKLGITKQSVRMDSQAKYGSIARGAGDIYLRLPTSKTYQEKIWDHAAGDLIVREAGGQVTDIKGNRLNFGVGRTLATNSGVIAAPKAVHSQVLSVVQEVLGVK